MNRKEIFVFIAALCLTWAINTPSVRAVGDLLAPLWFDTDTTDMGVRQSPGICIAVPDATGGKIVGKAGSPLMVAHDGAQPIRLYDGNGHEPLITNSPPSVTDWGVHTKSNIFGPSTVSGVIQPLTFNGNNGRAMVESTFAEETMPGVAFTSVGAFANCGLKSAYYDWVSIQITGVFDATVVWEGSDDGVTFVPHPLKALATGDSATSTTTAGIYYGDKQTKLLRARSSAYASGTALVTFELRGR